MFLVYRYWSEDSHGIWGAASRPENLPRVLHANVSRAAVQESPAAGGLGSVPRLVPLAVSNGRHVSGLLSTLACSLCPAAACSVACGACRGQVPGGLDHLSWGAVQHGAPGRAFDPCSSGRQLVTGLGLGLAGAWVAWPGA